jgi:hypothetical protein
MGAFLKAEAARVDGAQADAIAQEFQVGQNGAPLIEAEDHRQLLLPWGADKGEGGPFPFQGLFVEERDAAQRNGARAPRVVLDVLEGEEIVTQFFLRNMLRGFVVVLSQLPYSSDITLLGPCGEASELEVFEHALA